MPPPAAAAGLLSDARCLSARGRKDDKAKAVALLDQAERSASELGMRTLYDRVVDFRGRQMSARSGESQTLTRRELDVIRLIAAGKTNQEIASELCISSHTAEAHVAHILAKNGWTNRTQAATFAMRELLAQKIVNSTTDRCIAC